MWAPERANGLAAVAEPAGDGAGVREPYHHPDVGVADPGEDPLGVESPDPREEPQPRRDLDPPELPAGPATAAAPQLDSAPPGPAVAGLAVEAIVGAALPVALQPSLVILHFFLWILF